jgi:IMP dehydrogenase/GMP reductase
MRLGNRISEVYTSGLHFDDVFIVPTYSDITTRKNVDISIELSRKEERPLIEVPVMCANMETVVGEEMAVKLIENGAVAALHRFQTIDSAVKEFKIVSERVGIPELNFGKLFVSIGVNRDSNDRAKKLYEVGARYFIIDIAHGHSKNMKKMIKWMRKEFGDEVFIMAGNVATGDATKDLIEWGADAVKIGIGPGCFAAGTRILMSNGVYKNIEDIVAGDEVINKHGTPVEVKKSFCTGKRKVIKLKTNHFHEDTFVTPDHCFWIGDCANVNKKHSKYKWKEIGTCSNQHVGLVPANIQFRMPKTFSIKLNKKGIETDNTLKPSYELGYVFGTFLGDDNSHASICNNTHRGSIHWCFGRHEMDVVLKLQNALRSTINTTSTINITQKENVTKVNFYHKPLAAFLTTFSKKTSKHLLSNLLVDNHDYLKGLYDGLIDSDGHIDDNDVCFTNTSSELIELFSFLHYKLFGSFPDFSDKLKTIGNFSNCKLENCNKTWRVKPLKKTSRRKIGDKQIVKFISKEEISTEIPVYDLEIDCPTHSFIANNTIVHNSVCLTKDVTGVTMPQISAITSAATAAQKTGDRYGKKFYIVADGGCRTIGDVCKAIGAGADLVMTGRLFAGCDEAPQGTKYRGSASQAVQVQYRTDQTSMPTPEGTTEEVPNIGPVGNVVKLIAGGLRSSFSYVNAKNMNEFHTRCEFGVRFNK